MRASFSQSMAWLHTWAGLIVGWVLFVIFLGGTIACFDKELDVWMRPTLPGSVSGPVSMDAAAATMQRMAPHAHAIYLRPPAERMPSIRGFAVEPGKPYIDVAIDPTNGQLIPETVGGNFFFVLHYNLQAGKTGVYLVGLAGMLMLMALISGVIIHRRVFKEFFIFRPKAGSQRAWLDGHNLTGVLGLPFHLMIAYTGVAIMVFSYIFAGVQIGYRGDVGRFYEELAGNSHPVEQHRAPPALPSLDPILADATQRLGGPALYMELEHVHDASQTIHVLEAGNDAIAGGRRTLVYDGASGHFQSEHRGPGAAYRTYQFLSGLHRVQFGGATFRWLYFILGAAGCIMLASGMQVWIRKRSTKAAEAGLRSGYGLVRALNVGTVAGMPLASISLLWLNRLLPATLIDRATWESRGFFALWLVATLWAWLGLHRHGKPWRDLFGVTTGLLLGLPWLNAVVTPHCSLLHTLRGQPDWARAGVDLTCLVMGIGFAWLTWQSSQPHADKPGKQRQRQLPPHRTAIATAHVVSTEEALS